jgi:hypothetical protein
LLRVVNTRVLSLYKNGASRSPHPDEEVELLGRYPIGKWGFIGQIGTFSVALLFSIAIIPGTGQTILWVVSASIVGALIFVLYRLRILLKLFSSDLTHDPIITSTNISQFRRRRKLRNASMLLIGFFGPFAALYVLDAVTWLVTMLAVMLGVTGEELFNFISCRAFENRRRVRVHYFIKSNKEGVEMIPVTSGTIALEKKDHGIKSYTE